MFNWDVTLHSFLRGILVDTKHVFVKTVTLLKDYNRCCVQVINRRSGVQFLSRIRVSLIKKHSSWPW